MPHIQGWGAKLIEELCHRSEDAVGGIRNEGIMRSLVFIAKTKPLGTLEQKAAERGLTKLNEFFGIKNKHF